MFSLTMEINRAGMRHIILKHDVLQSQVTLRCSLYVLNVLALS